MLILQWESFESMRVYLLCGFSRHINPFQHKQCIENPQDYDHDSPMFTVGLPHYNVYESNFYSCQELLNETFYSLEAGGEEMFEESPTGFKARDN
jgi:hypothetical protein